MGRTSDIEKKISLQHAHILELSQKIETLKAEIEKMMAKLSSQEGIISGKEARLVMLEQDIEELKEMNKIHTKEAMVPVYSPNDTKIGDINKIEVEKKDMVHKKEAVVPEVAIASKAALGAHGLPLTYTGLAYGHHAYAGYPFGLVGCANGAVLPVDDAALLAAKSNHAAGGAAGDAAGGGVGGAAGGAAGGAVHHSCSKCPERKFKTEKAFIRHVMDKHTNY